MLPKDPMMLLSFTNTQLRDHYHSLDAFCENYDITKEYITEVLKTIDYEYDETLNKFV